MTSGLLSKEKILSSLCIGKFNGRDIKFENSETKLSKYSLNKEFFFTEGKGLTFTNGLYFILVFVSAIKFP